jgi:septum site-determining protein MinD
LLTRYAESRVQKGEMLSVEDVQEILAIPLLGIIPESKAVLNASNNGVPVTLGSPSDAKIAYQKAVGRLLGEVIPPAKGWKSKLLGGLRLFRSPA